MNTLIIIAGPTAVGKTNVSLEIAEHFNTEILSCDSRQFYREMKLGTAVPDDSQLRKIPHHFIGHLSIHDPYTVFKFETDALAKIDELFQYHDVVVLTGGSGLYLDAILFGMDDIPDPDPKIRKNLLQRFASEGIEQLSRELANLDPEYYQSIDKKNPKRILRGLEVCLTTGRKFSQMRKNQTVTRNFLAKMVILERPREELYTRIDLRVDQMFNAGLLEEARSLYPFRKLNALNTVGYKELFSYFDGEIDLNEAIRLIKRNSRHYAKRQITWNKKYSDSLHVHPAEILPIYNWILGSA